MKRKIDSGSEIQWNDSEGSFDNSLLSSSSSTDYLAGKIESLQMVNFMCHSNLELKFNSRVNFITGRNGSGKSAIMAALIVVLGGSASLTNRASGITDFIKKGENWAKVTITLINEGVNSFKKDIYGSRIVICRNLSSSGSHGYVVRAANGSLVSKKREEVDNVVFALNLQIKNPICVLNQDVARSFLCATDNSLRYTMFTKATQLDQLKDIYVNTLQLLIASKKHLSAKQKGIEEANAEMKQLNEKLKLFATLEKREKEKTNLENEYFWALVSESEVKIKELNNEKNKLSIKKEELSKEEEEAEKEIKEMEERMREWEGKAEEERRGQERVAEEKFALEREIQTLDRQIEKEVTRLDLISAKLKRQLEDIEAVKEHLKQSDNIDGQSESEKEELIKRIKYLVERVREVRSEGEGAGEGLRRAVEGRERLRRRVESLRAEVGEAEQNLRRVEVVAGAGAGRGKGQRAYGKYGQHTEELLRAIDEADKRNYFQKKPIGPCGMYVSLKEGNGKWARAVESVTGGLMCTYRCDNIKDFQVLSKIMEKICGKKHPSIIIGKFLRSRHNVEGKKVICRGFQSVFDVLSFDNDIVFNTFIDQARIETILLFESDEEASSLLTNIQNVPKNLRMGVTIKSDQYFPSPNYRTYYGNRDRGVRYLCGGVKGGGAGVEGEVEAARREVEGRRRELERGVEAVRLGEEEVERWKGRVKGLKQEEGKAEVELKQLRDLEETRPVGIRRVALEEELEGLEGRRRELEGAEAVGRGAVEALWERRRGLEARMAEVGRGEGEGEGEWERRVEAERGRWRRAVRGREGRRGEAEGVERRACEVEGLLGREMAEAERRRRRAEEVCPERMETEKSPMEIKKLLEKCERYLKAAEKMSGSREATEAEYRTKKELFQEMKRTAELLEKAIETLTKTAFKKERKLNSLQNHTSNLVSFFFQATLRTRGYDGQLKVDFTKRILDLEVKPKDATVARKDSKTLSGGERSYSTVSFILAIWKVVQMPVYFLDEFDVFMDKINRKVIMDLLLEHANAHSNKQFVFITPQDISTVQPSDVISVFRLADPERKCVK